MEQHKNQGGELSGYKAKLMISYGGKIQPRSHDHQLTYSGGDTKILTVDRNIKFLDIVAKVNSLCNLNGQFRLKYQLPGEDLDALVSLIDDDDVENMMFEYARIHLISTKPARLRLFLFPPNQCATPSALVNPDFLFGFDKAFDPNTAPNFENPQFEAYGNSGSDPETGAEKPVETEIQGMTDAMSHNRKVPSGPDYAYTARAPLIYWVPAVAGAYQNGVGQYGGTQGAGGGMRDREQPVYNFLPVTPSVQDQHIPSGVHVATNHTEAFGTYRTAKSAVSINHGTQVPQA